MPGATYVRVALLAIAGGVLALGFVLFFSGGVPGGRTAEVFETYVQESVQGLDVGAPVRYRGVMIGRVTEVALVSASYPRPEGVAFDRFFQLIMVRFSVDRALIGEVPPLSQAIPLGFRARVAQAGITGVRYLELDFIASARSAVDPLPWTPRYAFVPSVPSTVSQVANAAEALALRLQNVPLEDILGNVSALLANLNRQTSDGDLAVALREASGAAVAIRQAVEGADLAGTITDLRRAVAETQAVIAGRETRAAIANAGAAASELRRAAERLPGTVTGLERTLRAARETTLDVQADLVPLLADLRATAANLRATSDLLRASPGQAVLGAPPERRR